MIQLGTMIAAILVISAVGATEVVAVPLDLYAERHHADIHSTARRLPSS
jgi:hypothetical protein